MRKKPRNSSDLLWRLLYPPRCPVCDEVMPYICSMPHACGGVCPACRGRIRTVGENYCIQCGKPLHEGQTVRCHDCERDAHFFTRGRALFHYEDIRESLYRFKYGGRREYAAFYAARAAAELGEDIASWHAEALVPVPLHAAKQRRRGYNQAALFAEELSALTGIPVREDLIVRVRNTTPQKELNHLEREKNLKRAFKLAQNDVKLKTIIIIDDIYTTGSTIDAMSRLLKEAGVFDIYFVTLAAGHGV